MLAWKLKRKKIVFITSLLASSVFYLPVSNAALVNVNGTTDSSATPDGGQGYNFNADNISLTINQGYTVGQTGSVSIDNTGNRTGTFLQFNFNDGTGSVPGSIGFTNPIGDVYLNADASAQDKSFTLRGDVRVSNKFEINGIGTFGDGVTVTGNMYDKEDSIRGGVAFLGSATVNGDFAGQPTTNSLDGLYIKGVGTLNFNGNVQLDGPYMVFQAPATVRMADGKVIQYRAGQLRDVVNGTTDATSPGTLEFLGGGTVAGTIGAQVGMTAVNLRGAAGKIVNFQGNLLNGTPLIFLNAATANLSDGVSIQSVDNQTGAATGTLQTQGASTVNGSIGATQPIALIALNAAGGTKEIVLKGTQVKATQTQFIGGGGNATTLTLDAPNMNFVSNIIANNNKLDILNIKQSTTLTGNIGGNANLLADIWNYGNTLVQGNVFANLIHTAGTTELRFADGAIIQSDFADVPDGLNSSVVFLGNATVNGDFASKYNGVDGVYLRGNGVVVFNGEIYLDAPYLTFQGASTARIGDGVKIWNPVNETADATSAQGILEFIGNGTASGRIGFSRGLAAVRLTGDGTKTVNFAGDILNGTPLIFQGAATAKLADGLTIQSVDNTAGGNTGALQLVGAGTIMGKIGETNPIALIQLNSGGGAKEVVLRGTLVQAATTQFVGGGANPTTLTLNAPNMVFTGNITTNNNNLDILNILQSTTLTGDIGTAGKRINAIQLNAGILNYNGNAFAVSYQSGGTLQNAGSLDLSGNQAMNAGTIINNGDIKVNSGPLALLDNTLLTQNAGTITGNVALSNAGGVVLEMNGGTIDGMVKAALNVVNTLNLQGGTLTKTLTLGNQGDTVNFFNTQAQTIQGGAGDDTINIQATGGNFTLADGGGGNNTLNVNATFIANGNINDFQTINIADNKILTANQAITGLDLLLSLGHHAQMVLAQDVTGTGQVQNAGLIQLNANRTLTMGDFTNNGDIQMGAGALVKGTKLTQNNGTLTGDMILQGAGGEVLALNGGVINGNITAQGAAVNIFNLTGGPLSGTLTLGDHGDTVNLNGVAVQTLQGGAGNDILNVNATVTNGLIQNIETIQVKNAGTVFTVNQPIQNVNTLLAVSPNTQLLMNASIRGAGNVQNQGRLQVNNAQVLAMAGVTNQGTLTLQETGLIQADTLTQNGGASLSFGLLDGTTFGKIELKGVGNVANLAGDVSVYFPGTPPKVQTDYDVVVATAGGQIVDNTNFVAPVVSGLQLRKWMPSPQILRITSIYDFYKGTTINATEAANALQSAQGSGDPDIRRVVNSIGNMNDDEEVTCALEGLIPAADHGAVTASRASLQRLFDVVTHRQIELRNMQLGWKTPTGVNAGDGDRCFWGEWGEVYGALIKQKPMPDNIQGMFTTTGYHVNVAGFAFGGDFGNRNTARLGLAGNYTRMNVKSQMEFKNTLGINSYQLTAYGWFQPLGHALFTEVRLGLATNDYYNTRHINVNNEIDTAAIANYRGLYYGGDVEVGYALVKSHYYFAPIVKIKATRLHLDQYVEEGAGGLNLSVSGQMLNQFALGSGIRIADKQKNLIPEANFMVLHDFTNATQNVTSTFLGGGDPFVTAGVKTPKTLYEIGLSLTTVHDERYKVTARYEFDFRPGFQAYSGYLQFYYLWD